MNKKINELWEEVEDEVLHFNSELDLLADHEVLDTERNRTLFLQALRLINQAKSQLLLIEINGKPEEN